MFTPQLINPFLEGDLYVSGDQWGTPRDNAAGRHTGADVSTVVENRSMGVPARCVPIFVGWWNWGQPRRTTNYGYGRTSWFELLTADDQRTGWQFRAAHLDGMATKLIEWFDAGQPYATAPIFEQGEFFGVEGNTGYVLPEPRSEDDKVSGRHCHIELIQPNGVDVNPLDYIVAPRVITEETRPLPPPVRSPLQLKALQLQSYMDLALASPEVVAALGTRGNMLRVAKGMVDEIAVLVEA